MRILASAIRSPTPFHLKSNALAGLVTAVGLIVSGALLLWLIPTGCDLRGDAVTYRWTCLLPGLLIFVALPVGLFLPTANGLNHRMGRPLPDGWLVTISAAGLLAHTVLIGWYGFNLDPAYRDHFAPEVIFIPQPFVAGAIGGAIFCVARYVATRCRRVT